MSKGSYSGGGTIIGPRDAGWFGKSGVKAGRREDAPTIALRQANPLTADAEKRISNLRVDIAGLNRQVAQIEQQRAALADRLGRSRHDLAALLTQHGLPLDAGLPKPIAASKAANQGKANRSQRRKNMHEKKK